MSTLLLVGWAAPTSVAARVQPADCRAQPAVPPDYLIYHGLASPQTALAAPRPDAACAVPLRRLRT